MTGRAGGRGLVVPPSRAASQGRVCGRRGGAGLPLLPPATPTYPAGDPLQGYNILPWTIASFETASLTGYWQGSNATLATTASTVYDGASALQLTSTAAGDCTAATVSTRYPIQGGRVYYGQLQVQTATAGVTAAVEVDFYDLYGTLLSSQLGPYQPVGSQWTLILGPLAGYVAPAAAVTARVVVHATVGAGGVVVLADALYVGVTQDPPAFTSNTYISFDPPTTANPAWVDATQFVEIEGQTIQIQHGRQDGLSDVNTGTLSMTVNNSDGRWFAANVNGAWYGNIRKGAWIKQTVSFDGVQYTRFLGFITSLPLAGFGAYTTSQIQGSDWLSRLGQALTLKAAVYHESMTDPYGLPAAWAYYALNEQAASTSGTGQTGVTMTANDAAAYAAGTGMSYPLAPRSINAGGGTTTINWAAGSAPGFDNDQAISFAPNSASSGYALRGQLSRSLGASWLIQYWINSTTEGRFALTLADYSGGVAGELLTGIDYTGSLIVSVQATSHASSYPTTVSPSSTGPYVADGQWHLISIFGYPSPAGGGQTRITGAVDTQPCFTFDAPCPTTLQTLTVGAQDDQLGLGPGNLSLFAGSLYGLSITDTTNWSGTGSVGLTYMPSLSITNLYQAAKTGFAGELTGARLSRIARYAGVPAAWCNFDTGTSMCGPQTYLGRYPLDVLREASRTEAMPLYGAIDGRITMRPRAVRYNPTPAWTLQAADFDPQTTAADDYSYIINQAQVTRVGGSQVVISGARGLASQAKYGLYYTSQQTASYTDTDVANLGSWLIVASSDPAPRILPVLEAATLSATPSPLAVAAGWGSALYQAVLTADLSTAFQITSLPAQMGGGSLMQMIEGWTETITAAQHTFAYNTTYPAANGIFQLDTNPYNQLDAGYVLAY
jgi:hypothetical protein